VRLSELLSVLGLGAERAEDVEDALLAAIAEESAAGDAARAEVARQLGHLGTALGAAVNVLNPELVVLGGFLASLLAADPTALDAALSRSALAAPREDVKVVRAELGPNLLMVGAAELAFAPLLSDPAGFSWPGRSGN
jgi:predicted NBD/HSP70 family sugar kinase